MLLRRYFHDHTLTAYDVCTNLLHKCWQLKFWKIKCRKFLQGGAEETHVFQMASTWQGWGWWRWAWASGQLRQCSFNSHGHWNVEHRVFAVEQFFRNGDSIVTVRLFHRKFNVRLGAIPDRNTILWWVEGFRTTGYVGIPQVYRVYMNRPHTIEELKLAIRQEIAALPQKLLERAMQDFEERLRMCVRQEGRHLTDIIFRT